MSLISRMPPSTVVSERLGRCDPPPPAIILPPPASCGPCLTPPFLTVPLGSPLSLRGGLPWGGACAASLKKNSEESSLDISASPTQLR